MIYSRLRTSKGALQRGRHERFAAPRMGERPSTWGAASRPCTALDRCGRFRTGDSPTRTA